MMFSAYTIMVALALDALSSQPEFADICAVYVLALLLFAVLHTQIPHSKFRDFGLIRSQPSHQ